MHWRVRNRGVTLLELCFALGLLALLAGLAAPSYKASLRAAAVRTATYDLLAGLHRTRASAILMSRTASLCPTRAGDTCLPASASGDGWKSTMEQTSGSEILSRQSLPRDVRVRSTRSPIRFHPQASGASTGTLTICDLHGVAPARAIVISQTGRARVTEATADGCAP